MTDTQTAIYNVILCMNNNGPLTAQNRDLLMSVDFTKFGITDSDKETALRQYEYNVGVALAAA